MVKLTHGRIKFRQKCDDGKIEVRTDSTKVPPVDGSFLTSSCISHTQSWKVRRIEA